MSSDPNQMRLVSADDAVTGAMATPKPGPNGKHAVKVQPAVKVKQTPGPRHAQRVQAQETPTGPRFTTVPVDGVEVPWVVDEIYAQMIAEFGDPAFDYDCGGVA